MNDIICRSWQRDKARISELIVGKDILRARVIELEDGLDKYGRHKTECELYPEDPDRDDPHCNCGLNALLWEGK